MDLLTYAIQMETDGEKFYRDLAGTCAEHEGVRFILNMLADDEAKHRRIFEDMQAELPAEMTDSGIIVVAVNQFRQMQQTNNPLSCTVRQKQLYKEAYELEMKSYEFYMEQLDKAVTEAQRALIHRIAKEEKRHAVVLENIIEMILRPEQWVENAEFNHMEEY